MIVLSHALVINTFYSAQSIVHESENFKNPFTTVDWPVNMTGVIHIMMTVNLNDAIGYVYDMTGETHIMMTVNLNDAIGYAYDIYLL